MSIIKCYICHCKGTDCFSSISVYRGHVIFEHNSGKYNMYRCLIEGCSSPNTEYMFSSYIKHFKTSHGILNVTGRINENFYINEYNKFLKDSIEVENVTISNEPIAEIVDEHDLQENTLIDSIKDAVLVYLSKFITTKKAALELIDMVEKIFNLTERFRVFYRNSAKMDFNFLNSLPNNILELTLYGDEVCVYNPLDMS